MSLMQQETWLLNQIITRGLENHIDYLGLFHRVYASLKTRDFPAELTTASKLQQAYLDEHKKREKSYGNY